MSLSVKEQIDAFLRPRSVAIIGASENPRRIGGRPISYYQKFGFPGKVYAVNPKYDTVQGVPSFPSPSALPEPVDLAIIAVSAEASVGQFEEVCRRGVKAVTIWAGGFAETGKEGAILQDRLTAIAREYGVGLNGPNCLGAVSFVTKNYATFVSMLSTMPEFPAGRVAICSQSGGWGGNTYVEAVMAGGRVSHLISTGNEAGLQFCDYLEYLADDPDSDAVIGYFEGIRDGQRLCEVASRFQQVGKPLLLNKVGKSPGGATTIRSHTGLMAGADAAFQAAFDRYGVIRLNTMEDMADHVRVYSLPPVSGGLSVATISGGAAVYVADACEELGIKLTDLQPETLDRLREVVPRFGIVRNPVDVTAQVISDQEALPKCLGILANDPGTGMVLMFIGGNEDQADVLAARLAEIGKKTDKPLAVTWWGTGDAVRLRAMAAGLTVFPEPYRLLKPLAHRLAKPAPARPSTGETAAAKALREAPAQLKREQMHPAASGRLVLDEWSSMTLVESAGIPTPRRWRLGSTAEVEQVAGSVRYPCVMKLLEPVVAHRAQVGAVIVNIPSAEELVKAWRRLEEAHQARVVLVAEQVESGLEMLVGALKDDMFGQRVVVGAGGVWTNELNDSVTLIPPFDTAYIEERLSALRLWPVLRGGARQPGYSVEGLVRTVQQIAALAWRERGLIEEFECNPVIVTRNAAIAVDALGLGTAG